MLACRGGHLETAEVLLENGADMDKPKEVRYKTISKKSIMSLLCHCNFRTVFALCT